jgi:hypothetical protein
MRTTAHQRACSRGVGGGQERTPHTNQVQNTQFTVQNDSEDDTNQQETEISIELTRQVQYSKPVQILPLKVHQASVCSAISSQDKPDDHAPPLQNMPRHI